MISEKYAKSYCREDIALIKNYEEAIKDAKMWDCHHINEWTFTEDELKKMNMYYNRPASELIFLTKSDHRKIHYTQCAGASEIKQQRSTQFKGIKKSAEHCKKISDAKKGVKRSPETVAKFSKAKTGQPLRGTRWYKYGITGRDIVKKLNITIAIAARMDREGTLFDALKNAGIICH